MNARVPRPARPFRSPGPGNPFPGIAALERRSGTRITARLSANEALPLYSESLSQRYGQPLLEYARCYPDPSAFELRQALAARLGLSAENLLVDAGADALILLFLRVFADPGDAVVQPAGTYPTVEYFARSLGLRLCTVDYRVHTTGACADLDALARQARRENARVVYLANPDNPSGSEQGEAALAAFIEALPEHTLLILDEAYEAFGGVHLHAPLAGAVRLRSFSKAYGLAGMRVGYAIAHPDLLSITNRARVHYSVGTLAQHLAHAALEDDAHHQLMLAATAALRHQFIELAQSSGLDFFHSATNFVTLPLPSQAAAQQLQARLLALGASLYVGQLNERIPIARVSLQPELFTPPLTRVLFRPMGIAP